MNLLEASDVGVVYRSLVKISRVVEDQVCPLQLSFLDVHEVIEDQ